MKWRGIRQLLKKRISEKIHFLTSFPKWYHVWSQTQAMNEHIN